MDFIFLTLLPGIATVLIAISYLPQLFKTYKTKNVEGISVAFWALLSGYLFAIWLNAAYIAFAFGTIGVLITQTFNFVPALLMLIFVLRYQNK